MCFSLPPLLQLLHIPGVGHTTLNRLLFRMRERGISLEDVTGFSLDDLIFQLGLRAEWADLFLQNRELALRLHGELEHQSIRVLVNGDGVYPQRLSRILGDAAPAVLFVRGDPALLQQKSVAVVGVRKCSKRGIAAAKRCTEQLAAHSINIVSGNAVGIDRVAHLTVLSAGGTTIFVLAQGILSFHPQEELFPLLRDSNHLILSEFPPQLSWATHAAMQRNRTICALSHAVLLIESGTEGGTLATGKNALKLRVPLFAVDFKPVPSTAKGNPYFLQRGAKPIPEKSHILQEIFESLTSWIDDSSSNERFLLFQSDSGGK